MIPGTVTEIRYHRAGADPGPYRHTFHRAGPVRMYTNRDGSVTLRGRRPIWADDRAPDFDRYILEERAMARRRNPEKRQQQDSGELWTVLLIGAAFLFLFNRNRTTPAAGDGGGVGMPSSTVWISDPYAGGSGEFFVGSMPPGPLPPWREASQTEIATMIPVGIMAPGAGAPVNVDVMY